MAQVRTRVVVAATVTVAAVGALTAVAVPLVRSSDAATTELRVAPDSPEPPEAAPLAPSIRPLWTVSARAASATGSVEGPTVVAAGTDRLAGLDPGTGRERWSYRRGNARLCDWTSRDGVVIAAFAKSSGCRDLIGLDAGTGARRWYRNLEIRTDAVLTSGPGVAVATADSQLLAVDTVTGLNRWTHTSAGCRLDPAVVGRAAAAAVARCGDRVRLVLHDAYADKAARTVEPSGSDPRVVAAEQDVAVLSQVGRLPTLSWYEVTGKRVGSVGDPRLGHRSDATVRALTAGEALVLWTGRDAVAVEPRTRTVLWSAAATGPPAPDGGQVLLADARGVTIRPVLAGQPVRRVGVRGEPVPAGAALSRIGTLLVAAGAGRLVAYG